MSTPQRYPGRPETETRRIGRTLGLLTILAFLALGWVSFDAAIERREDPNRNLVVAPGASELVLKRNRAGHYLLPGLINGQPVRFLLDTGATQVSVPAHLGPALGLQPGASASVMTANGSVTVRQTRIDRLVVGPFELRNVGSHLNPGMRGDEVLLGMSALRHLEFVQRGDTLTLRVPGV